MYLLTVLVIFYWGPTGILKIILSLNHCKKSYSSALLLEYLAYYASLANTLHCLSIGLVLAQVGNGCAHISSSVHYINWAKLLTINKCTKHQFIHLLTATFKDLHTENSKNYKRWYCPHHTDCVSTVNVLLNNITFCNFCCFRCASP